MKKLFLLAWVSLTAAALHAEPKKLLVVTTTTGFRHASIPTLEAMLSKLAKDSGEFTVDFVQQPPNKPAAPKKPADLKSDALESAKEAHNIAEEKFNNDLATFKAADAKWNETLKAELEKLSPANLKNYDGVVFASTTGDLPLPDRQGFLDWIKAGHAFIGLHAASDTFHGYPDFIAMLGGEFQHHGPQVSVDCLNQDEKHPATAALPKLWTITLEEIYQFKNYDAAKVHDLLIMDKHPEHKDQSGHFAVSWCKDYGTGKVFYTSLGHREDVIDANPEMKGRKNSVEIAKAYQAHVLGGIEWALGLKK
jgi:type 1 glutamine amidotransferase